MLLLLLQVCFVSLVLADTVTPDLTKFRHQSRRKAYGDVENNTSPVFPLPRSSPQTIDGVDYRLTRLEVQVGEKAEVIRSELRETNRRLQVLEWQSAETHSALESFRAELQRFAQQTSSSMTQVPTQENDAKIEERLEHLAKGIMLVVVNWRALKADVAEIKGNISTIRNQTKSILEANKQLLTKQNFNNGLLDLKHRATYETCPQQQTKMVMRELPKDCKDVQNTAGKQSGIYRIQPAHSPKSFLVYCDMETRDGGWIVVHKRYEGAQEFYQDWHDYKHGFGNLGGEFWLGLDNIHQLTGYEVGELLVELEDFNTAKTHAHYSAFSVGPEVEGFPLKVLGGYSGDAGDSLIYHAGSRFSTKDLDQDGWPEGSCAQAHGGGWWYRGCDTSNLNGRYLSGELPEQYIYQGMYWGEFRGAQYSLYKARMLVRPRDVSTPTIFPPVPANDTDTS